MNRDTTGLGNLVHQPQYIPSNTRLARYAASYYRPVIYGLTALIIAITLIKYRDAPPYVIGGLFFGLFGYTAIFIWRMRMGKATEFYFYKSHVQLIRGQVSILSVTIMIFLLAAHGYNNHMLWLLYVLATLLISEHNSTPVVLFTLGEVALLYVFTSYVGWGMHTSSWANLATFWLDIDNLGSHVLGVWLVTFVFHYLVRNIHGRDKAFEQQQRWLELVAGQWMNAGKPQKQRTALVHYIEIFTGAKVKLWLPRLRDGKFINDDGLEAPEHTIKIAKQHPAAILHQPPLPEQMSSDHHTLNEAPVEEKATAQIIVPIQQVESPGDLIAILDICYIDRQPGEYQLEMDCSNLLKLTNHARLILINSLKTEQTQLEWSLSFQMHRLLNINDLAQQVANDVVEQLGFDFATVSLVDDDEDLIRCVAGCGADWVEASIHPLSCDDVQCQVVREGITIINDGKWRSYFDGRIWNRYRHARLSRVWVALPDPAKNSPYPSLGTIEAGFLHKHRKIIPVNLIHQLEQYAKHTGLAFANAELHQRTTDLAASLTALQAISKEIQQASAFFGPYQMVRLIGESAEKLLDADIVMLYTFDESSQQLDLAYITEHAIQGKGKLCINLKSGLLNKLYADRKAYYSSNARQDSLLVHLKDGQLSRKERTFTQRQNIKSVAGVPLMGRRDDILGFLCINYRRRREFYEEFLHIIELFAEQASVALEETYENRLARRVVIAQERNNLAAELHHTLSQHLYGLKQYARTAYVYAQRQESVKAVENLNKVKECATWSLQELQDMLNYLHEYPIGQIDFIGELTNYISRQKTLYNEVEIQFRYETTSPVSNQVQFYLLRIAREGINNALRHAQCSSVQVFYLVQQSGTTQLSVQDNGTGFNVTKARQSHRFGLVTMDYYARQINSDLQIDSQIGVGTCIHVSVSPPQKGA